MAGYNEDPRRYRVRISERICLGGWFLASLEGNSGKRLVRLASNLKTPPMGLNRKKENNATVVNASKRGAVSELIACAHFIELGYEVFRNVAASGPADLAIWNPETQEFGLVDVKTAQRFVKNDGSIVYHWARSGRKPNVRYLLICDGSVLGFDEEEDHLRSQRRRGPAP